MNQYIITEEELLDTRSYIYHEDEVAFSRIESKVRSHPYQSEKYCIWIEDDDGVYQTSCLHSFEFMDGTPESNGIKFCPYCGKELRQAGEPSIHIGFQNTTDIQASGGGGGCCNHEEYIKSIQQQRGEP